MTGTAPPLDLANDRASRQAAAHAVWIDLLDATEEERAEAERATGLPVPPRSAIEEIESSSRLVSENDVLTLSTPIVSVGPAGAPVVTPIAFVLSPKHLLTVRFANSPTFDRFAAHWCGNHDDAPSINAFLGLLEAMVDRLADVLEHIGGELDTLSLDIFRRGAEGGSPSRRRDAFLRMTLAAIGRKGAHLSALRDGLLGIGRIARYTREAAAWLPEDAQRRLKTLDRDIVSLNDYDQQLSGKVQFLLDATLGFINIEQNNTIKVLTVVSIVGIPPTFIASLYGMNFKNMPELNWTYGYPYALGLITLSIIIPILIFWRRGWL